MTFIINNLKGLKGGSLEKMADLALSVAAQSL